MYGEQETEVIPDSRVATSVGLAVSRSLDTIAH